MRARRRTKEEDRGRENVHKSTAQKSLAKTIQYRYVNLPAGDHGHHLDKGRYTCEHFPGPQSLPFPADSINTPLVSTC